MHLLEHMMFRGSAEYPSYQSLAEAFDWLGGEWNASTSNSYTEFTYSGAISQASKVIDLFASFVKKPLFLDLEKEKKIVEQEISEDINEFGNSTDLYYHTWNFFFPKSSLAHPVGGWPESVQTLQQNDLVAYRQMCYKPSNMVICITGGTTDQEDHQNFQQMKKNFSDYFVAPASLPSELRVVEAKKSQKGPNCTWVEHSDSQYQLQLSFLTDGQWSKDSSGYQLLSYLFSDGFSSLLFKELREDKALVYEVDSDYESLEDVGLFVITTTVALENLCLVLQTLLRLISEFCKHGPTEDDLRRAQVRLSSDLSLLPEDFEILSDLVSRCVLAKKDFSLEKKLQDIETVTRESVQRLAKKTFTPEKSCLVVLGPKDQSKEKKVRQMLFNNTFVSV